MDLSFDGPLLFSSDLCAAIARRNRRRNRAPNPAFAMPPSYPSILTATKTRTNQRHQKARYLRYNHGGGNISPNGGYCDCRRYELHAYSIFLLLERGGGDGRKASLPHYATGVFWLEEGLRCHLSEDTPAWRESQSAQLGWKVHYCCSEWPGFASSVTIWRSLLVEKSNRGRNRRAQEVHRGCL